MKNWNNQRRNRDYWIAIGMLGFVLFNPEFILNTQYYIIYKSYNLIDRGIRIFDKSTIGSVMALLFEIMICCVCLLFFIRMVNLIIGCLLNRTLLMSLLLCEDSIIGVGLVFFAIKFYYSFVKLAGKYSLASYMYGGILLIGSLKYWNSIFQIQQYCKVYQIIKKGIDYDKIWYCISNSRYKMSIFSKSLWKSKWKNIIVEKKDLNKFSNSLDISFKKKCIGYYLIVIDEKETIGCEFKKEIIEILKIPHAKVGIMILNGNQEDENRWHSNLQGKINIKIKRICNFDIKKLLQMDEMVEEVRIQSNNKMQLPFQFIQNNSLLKAYFEWQNESDIRLLFLNKILTELSAPQAIYALFDFVDLNYRIWIAYYDHTSLKNIGRIVGQLYPMECIVEQYFASEWKEIDNKQIANEEMITESEYLIIKKYMPNYSWKNEYGFVRNINYLTRKLRNILRGHGSFETSDLKVLYELVVKLAVINMYILKINELHLYVYRKNVELSNYKCVYGNYKGKEKNLSPFIIEDKKNTTLIFNNWIKKKEKPIEYMNFLNGTVEYYNQYE